MNTHKTDFGTRIKRGFILAVTLFAGHAHTEEISQLRAGYYLPRSAYEFSLDECIDLALEQNLSQPISHYARLAAEAQHQQALSGYWPQMKVQASAVRLNADPNFIFSGQQFGALAAQLLGGIPGGQAGAASARAIPDQEFKLLDRDIFSAGIHLDWLRYDGGLRQGMVDQAAGAVSIAEWEEWQNQLRVIHAVRKYYESSVLARELLDLGIDLQSRLGVTLDLTEALYKSGSLKIKKTDYLRNKILWKVLMPCSSDST